MVVIKTKMQNLPTSCKECELNRKSLFGDSSACLLTRYSTADYTDKRPLWCELIKIRDNYEWTERR